MKRLTSKTWTKWNCACRHTLFFDQYEVTERLADIEDILGEEYDLDRLREALQKQSEYEEFMERWKDAVAIAGAVKEVGADRVAELVEAYNLIGKKIYITKWPFKGRFIKDDPTERTIHHILVTKIEILLQFKDGAIPMSFLGKTAFLDRKEAKAALEKTKEANP